MASTASDVERDNVLHRLTFPTLGDERTAPASGESQNTAIWIAGDDSDTEDEDVMEGHDVDSFQSCCTTPTTTGVTDHSGKFLGIANFPDVWPNGPKIDSMSIKPSATGSDADSSVGSGPAPFSVPVEVVEALPQEFHMDIDVDSETNHQTLRKTLYTSIRGTTPGEDAGSATSPNGPESQLRLDPSNDQLAADTMGTAREPAVMVDDLFDEDCHGSQDPVATLSKHVHLPVPITPEIVVKTFVHGKETCVSSLCDDAILGVSHPSSHPAKTPPKRREDQDLDHESCSSSDAESDSLEEQSSSSPEARMSSPYHRTPLPRRSRRVSPRTPAPLQDEDSDADSAGSDSVDGLRIKGVDDEEYCPSPLEAQGHDSGGDSEDEEQHFRKRCRVFRSPFAPSLGSSPVSGCSRKTRSTKCIAQLARERQTPSVCGNDRPAPSQAIPVPSDPSSFLAQFEEWPLQDVILKRITEGGRTTFQLQFEWGIGSCQPCSRRPIPPKKGNKRPRETFLSGTTSSKSRWTSDEDETVYRMKQDHCSWAEIQRALPHRSQGPIQVRYSTKLKSQ
jgi:hypothetical protein